MADLLTPVAFCADLLPYVEGFNCGANPWDHEPAQWIQHDALSALDRGTKVWLYLNSVGDVVGFSSLGEGAWRYPTPKSSKAPVLVIPELGMKTEFHGHPRTDRSEDPRTDGRYSSQIMRHVLDVAAQWPGPFQAVGLFVDPRNAPAIKLYQRFGFEKFDPPFPDENTGVVYDRYAIRRP